MNDEDYLRELQALRQEYEQEPNHTRRKYELRESLHKMCAAFWREREGKKAAVEVAPDPEPEPEPDVSPDRWLHEGEGKLVYEYIAKMTATPLGGTDEAQIKDKLRNKLSAATVMRILEILEEEGSIESFWKHYGNKSYKYWRTRARLDS